MKRLSERRVRLPKSLSQERRASKRYPLALEVRYTRSQRRGLPETGSGRIIDLSSSGLRFTTERPLLPGLRLDVAIDWPVLLDGGVKLQLIATGVVVWTNGPETALRIDRHEFRTGRVGLKVVSRHESVG
jgi:hypothetical protein